MYIWLRHSRTAACISVPLTPAPSTASPRHSGRPSTTSIEVEAPPLSRLERYELERVWYGSRASGPGIVNSFGLCQSRRYENPGMLAMTAMLRNRKPFYEAIHFCNCQLGLRLASMAVRKLCSECAGTRSGPLPWA